MPNFSRIHSAYSLARYIDETQGLEWLPELRANSSQQLFAFAIAMAVQDSFPVRSISESLAGYEATMRTLLSDLASLGAQHIEYEAQLEVWKVLRDREKERRQALWSLKRTTPGSAESAQLLKILDDIADCDANNPIGDRQSTHPSELSKLVVVHRDPGMAACVFDEDIPEPWLERFSAASLGSTKPLYGWYAGDWSTFLRRWELEVALVERHRAARSSN